MLHCNSCSHCPIFLLAVQCCPQLSTHPACLSPAHPRPLPPLPARSEGTPQCFLLTPKLLPDLPFSKDVTVLQIMNGSHVDQASMLLVCKFCCCRRRAGVLGGGAARAGSATPPLAGAAARHPSTLTSTHPPCLQVATTFTMERLLGRQRMQALTAAA